MTGEEGVYTLTWPSVGVIAEIERIRENHDHEVKAEIRLSSQRPTSAGHIRQGRIILTSPTSRKSMAQMCNTRDNEVDWDQVLEQLSAAVLKTFRAGTPMITLTGNVDIQAQQRWFIEPVIQSYNPTLIYGPGSTGKSWFGQYLAVLADAGVSHGGLTVEPSTVLYADWETDANEIDYRITMLRHGLGLTGPSGIRYMRLEQGLRNIVEDLRRNILAEGVTFLILDSLGSACGGEPESADVVLSMFSALRSLKITTLCIDHPNKEGHLFGSVYKFNNARQVFECKKSQQQEEDKLIFGMFHRKANNSKLIADMGWELSFSEDAVTMERRDVRDTPLEEHMRVVDRIESLLRRGPLTAFDISEDLGKSESHIRKELSEWVRRGKFVSLKDGSHRYANASHLYEETSTWQL